MIAPTPPPAAPDGRRLGPELGLDPDGLNDPANAWAVELGATVAAISMVVDRRQGARLVSIEEAVAGGLTEAARSMLTRLDLPLGPMSAMVAPSDDPLRIAELLGFVAPCGNPECSFDHVADLANVRRALDEATDAVLILGRIVVIPGALPGPGTIAGTTLIDLRPGGRA